MNFWVKKKNSIGLPQLNFSFFFLINAFFKTCLFDHFEIALTIDRLPPFLILDKFLSDLIFEHGSLSKLCFHPSISIYFLLLLGFALIILYPVFLGIFGSWVEDIFFPVSEPLVVFSIHVPVFYGFVRNLDAHEALHYNEELLSLIPEFHYNILSSRLL